VDLVSGGHRLKHQAQAQQIEIDIVSEMAFVATDDRLHKATDGGVAAVVAVAEADTPSATDVPDSALREIQRVSPCETACGP